MSFTNLGLSSELAASLPQALRKPTEIQSLAIPVVMGQQDVFAIAQTGSGKTLAYGLPLIDKASQQQKMTQIIVLVPTRELTTQINTVISLHGEPVNVRSICLCGGSDSDHQIAQLATTPEIVIATPGRLLDLINQGHFDIKTINTVVLDEADRLLDMGFWPDINNIIERLSKPHQTLMFSATFPIALEGKIKTILNSPQKLHTHIPEQAIEHIDEQLYLVNKGSKTSVLIQKIKQHNWLQVLVFTDTKDMADSLCKKLNKAGISTAALHGNKNQAERESTLHQFKEQKINVLIATDLLARGIHIDQLPIVINFSLPSSPDVYIHRIGRTARAGKHGVAISLICHSEMEYLKAIRQLTQRELQLKELSDFPVTDTPSVGQNKRAPRDKKANRRTNNKKNIKNLRTKKNNH